MSLPGGMREHTKLTSFLLVICKKGHLITRFAEELPDEIKFCEICSEEIFRGCPKCDTPLISTEVVSHTHDFHYCGQCGEIFPWSEKSSKENKPGILRSIYKALLERQKL